MTDALILTDAGKTMLTSAGTLGPVALTHVALGDGTGAADKTLTALRNERLRLAAAGANDGAGRIAFSVDVAAQASAWDVTELGVIGQQAGNSALFAYWSAAAVDGRLTRTSTTETVVLAGDILIDQDDSGDITVTISPSIVFGAEGGLTGQIDAKAAAYAAVAADNGKTIEVNAAAAARTVTLPDLGATDNGFTLTVIKADASANAVTVDGNGADTIDGAADYVLKKRWESVVLKWNGAAWRTLGGADPAWVRGYIAEAEGGIAGAVDAKAAAYAVVAADNGNVLSVTTGNVARTVTLPDLGAGDSGFTVTVIKVDDTDYDVIIDGNGTDTINGAATYALKSQYEAAILKWTGSAWLAIGGASPSWLRDFLGAASHRVWDAAGTYDYTWEWEAETGYAVIEGAAGGGGGGGSSGQGRNGGYGQNETDNYPGGNRNPYGDAGGGGLGGHRSELTKGDDSWRVGGGGGGGDGNHKRGGKPGVDGDWQEQAHDSDLILQVVPQYNGHNGLGGGSDRPGGAAGVAHTNGGLGGAGNVKIIKLTGMTKSTALTIKIGAGGLGGLGPAAFSNATKNGGTGSDGRVTLIPLF